MTKKAKIRTKVNPILDAAIEDAFDECKNPDELSELTKNVIEKMTNLYWSRKNSRDDGQEED